MMMGARGARPSNNLFLVSLAAGLSLQIKNKWGQTLKNKWGQTPFILQAAPEMENSETPGSGLAKPQ